MDQWIAVLLRRWRNGILPSMWKAEITKKLESSGAALTQSVELMLDVQERFATVPNGPVADRVTAKLKGVLDKNPEFYVLKQVSNVLSGTDSKIPDGQRGDKKRWSEGDKSESEVLSGSLDNLSETDTPTTSTIPNSNVPRVHSAGPGESTFKVDDFVVVNFEGQLFPGRLTEVKPEGYIVSTMERYKKNWRWPDREDGILH
ncbi:hypothetical protein HPB50_006279 [Hyalomma asiaticum]|uniref:Uncharacterized protein n=1 Tax=Hyalomma asiaticum TaxID=266040 RepID=A0ACB7S0Q1_HYAAI|nr:hypothetical protein HPB50_006279 [Hyalomma asiaticum]